ncbi:hypothetical protein M413DRAFT_322567 [Hebeloma cylindrosporum]|uniref:Uncharacterized protein n=1 Tax=Hebeloma cylindrosporum TaxID=76867 RepID=A0A0C2Y504_HEBCY|nr:hypothetical protein M413DRAFT_322567 [Hebeloma cylindrosporum h7]
MHMQVYLESFCGRLRKSLIWSSKILQVLSMHHIRERDLMGSQALLHSQLFPKQEFSQVGLLSLPFHVPGILAFLQPLLLFKSSLVGMKFPFRPLLSRLFGQGNLLLLLLEENLQHSLSFLFLLLFSSFSLLLLLLLKSLLLPFLRLCRFWLFSFLLGDGDGGLSLFTALLDRGIRDSGVLHRNVAFKVESERKRSSFGVGDRKWSLRSMGF